MLHKDPDQRYQSYAELIEHMEYAKAELIGAAGSARKPKQRVVVGAGQQKTQGVIALVMLLVILGMAFGGYQFRDRIFGRQDGVQDFPTLGDGRAAPGIPARCRPQANRGGRLRGREKSAQETG